MESEVMKLAVSQGAWCALFVILFFWTLKANEKRESNYQDVIKENAKRELNYQEIIKTLSEKFETIEKGIECLSTKFDSWKK